SCGGDAGGCSRSSSPLPSAGEWPGVRGRGVRPRILTPLTPDPSPAGGEGNQTPQPPKALLDPRCFHEPGRFAMSDAHATGGRGGPGGEAGGGRPLAVELGAVMMVAGLGMSGSPALLAIGLPLGLTGLLVCLWGLFYATPPVGAAGPGHGHGHGTA